MNAHWRPMGWSQADEDWLRLARERNGTNWEPSAWQPGVSHKEPKPRRLMERLMWAGVEAERLPAKPTCAALWEPAIGGHLKALGMLILVVCLPVAVVWLVVCLLGGAR